VSWSAVADDLECAVLALQLRRLAGSHAGQHRGQIIAGQDVCQGLQRRRQAIAVDFLVRLLVVPDLFVVEKIMDGANCFVQAVGDPAGVPTESVLVGPEQNESNAISSLTSPRISLDWRTHLG
jgi:hypothetical protein